MGTFVSLKCMLFFSIIPTGWEASSLNLNVERWLKWMWNIRSSHSRIASSPRTEIVSLMQGGVVLFRAGKNLKHLHHAHEAIRGKAVCKNSWCRLYMWCRCECGHGHPGRG